MLYAVVIPVIIFTAVRGGWSDLILNAVEVIFDVEEVHHTQNNACNDQQYEVHKGKDIATKSSPSTRPGTLIVSSIVVVLCL